MSGSQEKSGEGGSSTAQPDGPADADRRQRLHEANNRLAAVIMNLVFARETLAACPPGAQLTELERADLTIALEHAQDSADRLAIVIRELG